MNFCLRISGHCSFKILCTIIAWSSLISSFTHSIADGILSLIGADWIRVIALTFASLNHDRNCFLTQSVVSLSRNYNNKSIIVFFLRSPRHEQLRLAATITQTVQTGAWFPFDRKDRWRRKDRTNL